MSSLDNPEKIDTLEYREDQVAIDLKDSGIDLRDLRNGEDCQFEVDPDSMQQHEEGGDYFDKEELFKQLNYDCLNCGDDDEEGTSPFTRMAKDMEDISPNKDGSVLKSILRHGAGAIVPPTALCRVHYNAYKEFIDEPFDSSYIRNRQKQFKLGKGEVLLGWEVGVPTMKRGETARFLFSPDFGFGKLGCPPRIPAEAWTLFEIQLISFVDQEAADSFENISEEERKQLSFTDLVKVVETLRLTGNEAFGIKQFGRALGQYSQGLRLIENANLRNESDEVKFKELTVKLCLNISLCEMKQNPPRYPRACKYARKVLDLQANNTTALYRLAKSLRHMGEYTEAKRRIYRASQLDPRNKEITEELNTLNSEIEKQRERESGMAKRMFQMNVNADNKPKESAKPKAPATMLEMVKNMLKKYESDPEQKDEIGLPANLTPSEISCVKDCAQELGLYMYGSTDGSYKITKR